MISFSWFLLKLIIFIWYKTNIIWEDYFQEIKIWKFLFSIPYFPCLPWFGGYHYSTTSVIRSWAMVQHRFESFLGLVRDWQWWEPLRMVFDEKNIWNNFAGQPFYKKEASWAVFQVLWLSTISKIFQLPPWNICFRV